MGISAPIIRVGTIKTKRQVVKTFQGVKTRWPVTFFNYGYMNFLPQGWLTQEIGAAIVMCGANIYIGFMSSREEVKDKAPFVKAMKRMAVRNIQKIRTRAGSVIGNIRKDLATSAPHIEITNRADADVYQANYGIVPIPIMALSPDMQFAVGAAA